LEGLAKFSTDDLLAEIVRRRNKSQSEKPIEHHCDECANFLPWTGDGDCPDDYNPCSKRHKMSFKYPDELTWPNPEMWGFYRRVCADRQSITPTK